jgi:predicted nucleic acid-binding protein
VSGLGYIDSSALLKLAVREAETSALEADLAERDGLLVSRLGVIECRRATARASKGRLLQTLEQVLDAVYLLEITAAILDRAAELRPTVMRTLDAIHVATALSVNDRDLDVITYDDRMADAARENGLRVVQPGRHR